MAILDRAEIKAIVRPWRRYVVKKLKESKNLNLSDLELAVQETEDWIEANQADYISVLSEPYKANTSAAAKILLFAYVALKRGGLL
jgi:hypothetical protein